MLWWVWCIVGIGLLCLEILVSADFYMFFLGIAAIIVGIVDGTADYLNYSIEDWVLWGLFAVLSVFLMIFLRRKALGVLYRSSPVIKNELVDEEVTIVNDIAIGETGEGEARGTTWSVKNLSDEVLTAGNKYAVKERDGIVLVIK